MFDKNKFTPGLFTDFQKQLHGVPSKKQFVKCNNRHNKWNIKYRVLESSIVGPSLQLIFANDFLRARYTLEN